MKKKEIVKPVDAPQQVSSYSEDIREIKELLKKILEKIPEIRINGGFE